MVNYSNGKIYKIVPIVEDCEESDIYVGSTTKTYLSQRMDKHRYDYKAFKLDKAHFMSSFILFDKYGIENCKIVLIEMVNANNKDELLSREAHYITTLKCVNKIVPNSMKNEKYKRDYNVKYREKNKERLIQKDKQKYIDNREKIKQRVKDNYQITRDSVLKRMQQYYKDNKEIISQKQKEKCTCDCGSIIIKHTHLRHEKSIKHQNYLKTLENNLIIYNEKK
jgi:hypothetical protein